MAETRRVSGPLPVPGAKYGTCEALNKVEGSVWKWRCGCGIEFERRHQGVRRDGGAQCEDCAEARRAKALVTHGLSGLDKDGARHPVYLCWSLMRDRCSNPNNPRYSRYGGRGISVCLRWKSAANFIADMLPSWQPGLSIERVDNDGNYGPGNCRWATRTEQANNTSATARVEFDGALVPRQYAAAALGIHSNTLAARVAKGQDITAPVKANTRVRSKREP